MTAGRMADHWWWRPGWRPGRRVYAFHFTFGDRPAVCELAVACQARLASSGPAWVTVGRLTP